MARRLPALAPWSKIAALAALADASFRYLLLDNAFGMLGFQVRIMAQAWLVLRMTDSDAWVGVANGLPAIPVAILGLFGGVLADRTDRRMLLVWSRLIFAAFGLITAALVSANVVELWHVIVLSFAVAAASAFSITASQTLIVDIAGRERLFSANAMFGVTLNLATFVGPAIGGVLSRAWGWTPRSTLRRSSWSWRPDRPH